MSLEALTWAFKQTLKPTQKIVLLALADYADDTGVCWPSMRTLAAKTSLTERAVRASIRVLEEAGLVVTEERTRPNGSTTSNAYRLVSGRIEIPGAPERRSAPPSPGTPPPEPSSNPQENTPPTPSTDHGYSEHFLKAWEAWPNKNGKAAAWKAWAKSVLKHRRAADLREIEGIPVDFRNWGLEAFLRDTVYRYGGAYSRTTAPKYIPMLSSWLNQERWSDPLPVDQSRGAYQPEPVKAQAFNVPAGHRVVRDEMTGEITGTEPIG